MCLVTQSCPTVWDPMDCSPPGSSVHGASPGKNTGMSCHFPLQGISQFRDQIQVSCIAGGFFTIWATREAQEYNSGWSIPSPGDLSDPGIEPRSPAIAGRFFISWANKEAHTLVHSRPLFIYSQFYLPPSLLTLFYLLPFPDGNAYVHNLEKHTTTSTKKSTGITENFYSFISPSIAPVRGLPVLSQK